MMWRHCCALVCALAALVATNSSLTLAQSDPSTYPLVQFQDLIYVGAFRLPKTTSNGDSFSFGGRPFAYNPARNSLFVGSRSGRLAEVSIPTPLSSSNLDALPFASYVQSFSDPMEGNLAQLAGAGLSGVLVYGDRLYGTASIYYDANNVQRVSHFSRSASLATPSFLGFASVWQADHSGFVAGYMAPVPTEWQAKLGAPAVTGQCCLPIAWRTSWGPAMFGWNPTHLGQVSPIPATPLLYYSSEHRTLGNWEATSAVYGATTEVSGLALLAGTRTALYFGRNGTGPFCYGNGTGDPARHGTFGSDGAEYCFDPTNADKGQHAFPYNYQIWAYDLNDLAAVKAGTKQPWDVVPYGVWPFALPFIEASARIGGIAYDSSRQLVYISQLSADQDGYEFRPLIHVLRVGGAAGAPLPAPGPAAPPPTLSGSGRTAAVTMTANKTAPQAAGTTITFTATPSGGVSPHQYKWWTFDGTSWIPMGTWTTSNAFNWTPQTANSKFRVAVWVRSYGINADDQEASIAADFPIAASAGSAPPPAGPSSRATAVAIVANKTAPQPAGTTITWTATPTGGAAPHQYKWWTFDGASWIPSGSWTVSNTLTWTPPVANAAYRVAVWVRSNGNGVDDQEASTAANFPITVTAVAPAPPAPVSSSRATAVSIAADKSAPQSPGTTITWTATPAGGIAPHQYKWWTFNGASWIPMGSWTSSNTYQWAPSQANAADRVAVWVRSATNSVDEQEASTAMSFAISTATTSTAPPPTTSGPPPAPSSHVSAVTLSADKPSPQVPGTTVTWSAAPIAGVAPHQYKWWVYDGTSWIVLTGWTTSSTYAWTPNAVNGNFKIAVWVRSAGNAADAQESSAAVSFPISTTTASSTEPLPTSASRATAVTITANKAAPQLPGSAITFTATPTDGVAPHSYKFYVWDTAAWVVARGWSTSNTFTWTPNMPNAYYKVAVWVRSSHNSTDDLEASNTMTFPITTTATTTATTVTAATATTSASVTAVTIGTNRIAPQPVGSITTFTAVPTGGTGPLQYRWWVLDGQTWSAIGTWTTTATLNWTAHTPNSQYRIGVWVRSAGKTADQGEAVASIPFAIQ